MAVTADPSLQPDEKSHSIRAHLPRPDSYQCARRLGGWRLSVA